MRIVGCLPVAGPGRLNLFCQLKAETHQNPQITDLESRMWSTAFNSLVLFLHHCNGFSDMDMGH
jgi:hypothetical protein